MVLNQILRKDMMLTTIPNEKKFYDEIKMWPQECEKNWSALALNG